ncbi:MAG TPA: hypothetical protein VFU82_02990 [Gammaproteobacteria bacterium]|jgi:hypothetical protein|nr:hypothetical protein [Gammaproteobacteria bacterium]
MRFKSLFLVAAMSLSASAFASPSYCNYVDHLHVSSNSMAHPHIVGAITATAGIMGVKTDDSSFNIVDKQQQPSVCNLSNDGTVTVTFATSASDYCTFHINDGPEYDNPDDRNYQCVGHLSYLGLAYDGFGSYSYSMIFRTI